MVLTFTASVDHDELDPTSGNALVDSYEITVYEAALPYTLVGTENLGKPTPVAGVITVSDSALLNGLSIGLYTLTVATLGPQSDVAPDQIAISEPIAFEVTDDPPEEPPALVGAGRRFKMLGGL